jgi:arylformamidase
LVIDITREIYSGMEVFEGDPEVSVKVEKTVESDGYSLREIRMSTHAGTHMDAPSHFHSDGSTMSDLDISRLLGHAYVTGSFRDAFPDGTRILLSRKGDLDQKRAVELLRIGIDVFGTDENSLEPEGDSEYGVHRILLGAGAIMIENLDLSNAPDGTYGFVALPLRIRDGDGAPLRAVLLT